MTTKLNWKTWWQKWSNFQPKQQEAERAADQYDYVLYGGAAGGGKSYFLRHYPVKFLIEHCFHKLGLRGVRVGIFCEDYPTLWDRHINRIQYEFPSWLGQYHGQQKEFVLDKKYGGGVIAFRNLDDPSKYMSSEFALIGVDEITKNRKETFDFLRMRLRWTGVPRPKFIGGTNPGGVGHDWVKSTWIDRKFSPDEKQQDQFFFIGAKAIDNKYLPDSYYQVLDSMPEKMRKAYRDGNWDTFEGQYFTEWNREQHVITPFDIPSWWKKFRAYDHGREAPAACGWYAVDNEGRVWKYREFYHRGLNVDQIAEAIKKLSVTRDTTTGQMVEEQYEYSIADPSIFASTGFVDKSGGQTIAESFARNGITFFPASNRRLDGWNIMHQYLHWNEKARPKLIYFSNCIDSIRTIPSLIHYDPIKHKVSGQKVEDVDTMGEDHAADCDRYFLTSLHEQKTALPKTEVEEKLEQIRQENAGNINPSVLNKFYQGDFYRKRF